MSSILNDISMSVNIARTGAMIQYLRRHSPEETADKVIRSLRRAQRVLIITIVIGVAVMLVMAAASGFFGQSSSHYDDWKVGYVNKWEGYLYYTAKSREYHLNLSDYGYNIADFENNDKFEVVLSEDGSPVKITPYADGNMMSNLHHRFLFVAGLLFAVALIVSVGSWLRYSRSEKNPGKDWYDFVRWYDKNVVMGREPYAR